MAAADPSIILCADDVATTTDVRDALERAGYETRCYLLGEMALIARENAALVILDEGREPDDTHKACRHLSRSLADRAERQANCASAAESFMPLLYITANNSPQARLACLEAGADAYLLRPFEPAELLAQVRALLRWRERHDALAAKTSELQRANRRLSAIHQQHEMELDLARRIQESFLPQSLPHLSGVRFAVKYKPCDRVGGDFYDVFRLDEHHVGFYIADAMGHGVPASLLTVFVKKGVHAKEITGNSYRLVPPNEVLQRLNRDMLEQALSENPFITMAYVLYNTREQTLQFSRAGHPYPLYLPADGPPRHWQIEGSLLGVFDVHFRLQKHMLNPGDKVLLYTDGMDGAGFADMPLGLPSLLAALEAYRGLGITDLVERLALDLFAHGRQSDDLTVLGMEVIA